MQIQAVWLQIHVWPPCCYCRILNHKQWEIWIKNSALVILFYLCLSPSLPKLVEGLDMYIRKQHTYRAAFRSDAGGHPHGKNHQRLEVRVERLEDLDAWGLGNLKGGRDIRKSREKQGGSHLAERMHQHLWVAQCPSLTRSILNADPSSAQPIELLSASTSVLQDGSRTLYVPFLPCLFSPCEF